MTVRQNRRSIFWGLTLIAVGILFLYQNFNPAIHAWHIIARFWPVILILWGISKLVDYIESRAHPEVPARPLFSPNEVVLLIVVLILGTLLSKAVLRPWGKWSSEMATRDEQFAKLFMNSYTFSQQISQPAAQNSQLLITNAAGNVEIHGADQPEITALVQETIWAESEEQAKNISQQLNLHFTDRAGQYVMESGMDSMPHKGHNVRLDFSIRVPHATAAIVTVTSGNITLDSLKGSQTLTARTGDVRVANIDGSVRVEKSGGTTEIHDVQGSVELNGRGDDVVLKNIAGKASVEGRFSGNLESQGIAQSLQYKSSRTALEAQKLAGSLTMDMGSLELREVQGPLEISTREQDIRVDNFQSKVQIANADGNIDLQTVTIPSAPINVETRNGNINLSLPDGSNFQIEATSRHGNVSSDFPGLKVDSEDNSPSIRGICGKGGPMIHLTSTYGTIRVMRNKPQPSHSQHVSVGPQHRSSQAASAHLI